MINYSPLEWLLNAQEEDTNSATGFWRLGADALFMRNIAGKFALRCCSCTAARHGSQGTALPSALTHSCGSEGGRDRPEGEAFLGRVPFSPLSTVAELTNSLTAWKGRSIIIDCLTFPHFHVLPSGF